MPGRPAARLIDSPAPKGLVGHQDERTDVGGAAVERMRAPFHPRKSSRQIDPILNRLGNWAREPFVTKAPNERLAALPFVGNKGRCFGFIATIS
jgi:hypothetical protein